MIKFKEHLGGVKLYEAGKPIELVVRDFGVAKENVVKLASNENPHGTSPAVVEGLRSYAAQAFRYPDDSYYELKEALAAKFGVGSENIIVGSGSDQIFEFVSHALLDGSKLVLQNKITFAMYEVYATQEGAKLIKTSSTKHDLGEFKKLYAAHKPDLIYLCTPSNPIGDALDSADVFEFLASVDPSCLVVLDAAYMEYAAFKDAKKLIRPREILDKFSNVIYTGTFSKAYALGGMRVGYGIARKEIIDVLLKLRAPFNITNLSLKAATLALSDEEFVNFCLRDCFLQMKRFEYFASKHGISYEPSFANFITYFFTDKDSSALSLALLKSGVIVRDLRSYGLNAIRITIGTGEQNSRFFESFSKVI